MGEGLGCMCELKYLDRGFCYFFNSIKEYLGITLKFYNFSQHCSYLYTRSNNNNKKTTLIQFILSSFRLGWRSLIPFQFKYMHLDFRLFYSTEYRIQKTLKKNYKWLC